MFSPSVVCIPTLAHSWPYIAVTNELNILSIQYGFKVLWPTLGRKINDDFSASQNDGGKNKIFGLALSSTSVNFGQLVVSGGFPFEELDGASATGMIDWV